jgi:hypothetical protein
LSKTAREPDGRACRLRDCGHVSACRRGVRPNPVGEPEGDRTNYGQVAELVERGGAHGGERSRRRGCCRRPRRSGMTGRRINLRRLVAQRRRRDGISIPADASPGCGRRVTLIIDWARQSSRPQSSPTTKQGSESEINSVSAGEDFHDQGIRRNTHGLPAPAGGGSMALEGLALIILGSRVRAPPALPVGLSPGLASAWQPRLGLLSSRA